MRGKELSRLRRSKKVTQRLLAELTGWRQHHISRLESYDSVRASAVSKYLAGLEQASLRVSEERAALEARDRETLARLLPSTSPLPTAPRSFDPETPTGPSSSGLVPSGTVPVVPPTTGPEVPAKMTPLQIHQYTQSRRALSPSSVVPSPAASVSATPPVSTSPAAPSAFKLNSKPERLEVGYSSSYTRAYSRLFNQSQGRVTVIDGVAKFVLIAVGTLAQTTVELTRTTWIKRNAQGNVTGSGENFDHV